MIMVMKSQRTWRGLRRRMRREETKRPMAKRACATARRSEAVDWEVPGLT